MHLCQREMATQSNSLTWPWKGKNHPIGSLNTFFEKISSRPSPNSVSVRDRGIWTVPLGWARKWAKTSRWARKRATLGSAGDASIRGHCRLEQQNYSKKTYFNRAWKYAILFKIQVRVIIKIFENIFGLRMKMNTIENLQNQRFF